LADPDFEPDTVWIAVQERKRLGPTALWITDTDPLRGYAGLTGCDVRGVPHTAKVSLRP